MAKKTEKTEETKITPESIAASMLKANESDHLNFEEEVYYKVSTGSFLFDKFLGGGIPTGLHRFGGEGAEVGKTSCALQCMKNHLESPEYDGRGVYFKAEGRLSPEMKERTGINFVWDANKWERGTCLVIESNVFEFILNFVSQLIKNNPLNVRYFMVLDSMDTVGLRKDLEKEVEGDAKVAGVPKLFKQYCQKMANALGKLGHIFIITAQKSATININPYAPDEKRQMEASGGNSLAHQSSIVAYFLSRIKDDLILENPDAKPDIFKNKIVGHRCRLTLKKTVNEKTGLTVFYYVKYGRSGGKSVWIEREIAEILIGTGLIGKKGAWFNFQDDFLKELNEKGFDIPESIQGMEKVYKIFEDRPELVEYVKEKFKNLTFEEIIELSV